MKRIDRDQIYRTLVRSHASALYRFAYRLSGRVETAEDLVQDTYCEAWRSIDSLREADRGKAWLFRILRRRYAKSIEREKRTPPITDNGRQLENISGQPGRDVLDLLADRELLQKAIGELDERFREPFLLMFVDGLSWREVALALEIPEGTVLSRIHRARVFLRARLRALAGCAKNQTGFQTEPSPEEWQNRD